MNSYNFLKKAYPIYILLFITILVYFSILTNDFLYYWDDQWMVMNRYTTGGWTFNNLWRIFTDFYNGQYGPFTELSYLIIYTFVGYSPLGFHLASLLWHLGCVYFVWKLIILLLEMHGGMENKDVKLIAFLTSLLFAIHPMNVEAVAWISAVKILIYAFFYLLGLILYIRYVQTEATIHYLFVLMCFIMSFLGKEQAVTFPLALVLIDWFIKRDLKNENLWLEKAPFFLLAFFFGFITILSQGSSNQETVYSLFQRLVFACYAFIEYITKSFLPIQLNYLYPFPIQPGEPLPIRFSIYPFLILCLITWIYMYKKNLYLLFGVMFFVIHLIVSVHIIPMSRHSVVADRYLYLSYIGIAFLVAYGIYLLKKQSLLFKRAVIFFICYLFYLSGYTFYYSRQWENTGTVKQYMKELLDKRKERNAYVKVT